MPGLTQVLIRDLRHDPNKTCRSIGSSQRGAEAGSLIASVMTVRASPAKLGRVSSSASKATTNIRRKPRTEPATDPLIAGLFFHVPTSIARFAKHE